ncbi:cytochrome b/b6 domain-containing protein [Curvibacter sp. APW13]|uniref:cytochrome b n=1 Tax=Curvibacter sp. APW13 TaxID=3077236 RepID=UPI0028DE9EE3|nr:cytochrome b/b6 domain-containing protein [Curvibacter sp. APW13]MDT8989618.1 cytochrome b/b6 domain-containing protein [Curvibacter sp. APW13]
MTNARKATRHHPLLVGLHWLTGLMLLLALGMGTFALAPMPLDAPDKVGALKGHMSFGVLLGVLMLVRLGVHVLTVKTVEPTPSSGSAAKDALAKVVHVGLYVLVFAMVGSGLATSLTTGLSEVVWGGVGGAVPANLHEVAPRIAHGWIAKGIALLVVLHVAGALMRHFVNRDGTLGRMWFGKR